MATKQQLPIFFFIFFVSNTLVLNVRGANWCVARSDASNQALQTALDYACAAGADCSSILSNGLCFLPNTIQAHASYAFNSYFQKKSMAPGSCDFSGTATVAKTDPSYGSCVYPSSLSSAGGPLTPTTANNNPNTATSPVTTMPTAPTASDGTIGLNPGGLTPTLPTDNSKAPLAFTGATALTSVAFLLVFFL
ncbi:PLASMODESMATA CALLOSE-BINDING PROTEIN 2 [Mercurialis annua]|uniref:PLASMODESMATA CALLOSE-BINDING PROTEIN 2 n=1 Tax=Mercurialis annua TaxID=3986 RepID=UPI00215F68C3|nr:PLASMODESMATA CALLOSE-BINDING PROTEIN 2 [Mercurialis annua]